MRILYLHQYFCTPSGHSGVRSYEFARRFVEAGHEVEVVTGGGFDPSIPAGRSEIDGIRVWNAGVGYSPKMGAGRRIYSYLKFALRSTFRAARARGVDVVLATSTPLTIAIPGLAGKWIAGIPLVFEVRDVWPDAAIESGFLNNSLMIAAARKLELVTYSESRFVVPLSTGMEARLIGKGVPAGKMRMIPNCCDLERFRQLTRQEKSKLRLENGVDPDKFIIVYSGAINYANDIGCMADAIDRLIESEGQGDWEWWFVGGGSRLDWLREQSALRRWDPSVVKIMGFKPREELTDLISMANCGVVSFSGERVFYENSPNKFFDYIAGGLPVVFNRSTWLEALIQEYGNGKVGSGGAEELAANLAAVIKSDDRGESMGLASRRLAEEEFSRDEMAVRYLDLLAEACEPDSGR